MTLAAYILGALFVWSLAFMAAQLAIAPRGHEDAAGYHDGDEAPRQ